MTFTRNELVSLYDLLNKAHLLKKWLKKIALVVLRITSLIVVILAMSDSYCCST